MNSPQSGYNAPFSGIILEYSMLFLSGEGAEGTFYQNYALYPPSQYNVPYFLHDFTFTCYSALRGPTIKFPDLCEKHNSLTDLLLMN
jgi:hypothetical protein